MAQDYRVVVHFECIDALPRSGKRREAISEYLRILGAIAHLGGDFQMRDPDTSRTHEVTQVAGFAVTWWIDGPVNEVKVVDIRPNTN